MSYDLIYLAEPIGENMPRRGLCESCLAPQSRGCIHCDFSPVKHATDIVVPIQCVLGWPRVTLSELDGTVPTKENVKICNHVGYAVVRSSPVRLVRAVRQHTKGNIPENGRPIDT